MSRDELDPIKVTLLGAAGCGKTSLGNRWAHGTFLEGYKKTSAIDFFRKETALKDGTDIKLFLFDLAGDALNKDEMCVYLKNTRFFIT